MSITRQVTVWCDHCGAWDQITGSATELRKQLQRRGWKHLGKEDYCGRCKGYGERAQKNRSNDSNPQ